MAGFRFIRNCSRPYEIQGMIYFTLANYWRLPKKQRERIDRLIIETCEARKNIAEVYAPALRGWLIEGKIITEMVMKYAVREQTLVQLRLEFYERW